MLHCPYCGNFVKEDESYCIHCGSQLPSDMLERGIKEKTPLHKYWRYSIITFFSVLLIIGISFFLFESKVTRATDLYVKGEEKVEQEKYEEAKTLFTKALDQHRNFHQAAIALEFTKKALHIKELLQSAEVHATNLQFNEALDLTTQGENELKNYKGAAVSELINKINEKYDEIKISQLTYLLEQESSIDDLKILLWEAENVGAKAEDITASIRQQIIDYTFSKASELLNEKQFNDALLFVEDGLKYAPDSEKLLSLKTTIDKEKIAFETAAQERIEKAMTIAEEESKRNETDAVELISVQLDKDTKNNLIVKGEVKSTATIPVHSIMIEYEIVTEQDEKILANEVFVYPETIYPKEKGKFEFTHYEVDGNLNKWKVQVKKIKWYTD